jgi:TonB family protein
MAPADAPIQAGASQYVLIPLIKAFAECSAAVDWDRATQETGTMNRPSGSQHIEPPKKLRHVNPRYPPAAQRARIQGVIFASALVSDTGCIPRAQILRSIPPLDLAALAAVVQWEYSPTRLDGKPVPTEMTVTLNFVLR